MKVYADGVEVVSKDVRVVFKQSDEETFVITLNSEGAVAQLYVLDGNGEEDILNTSHSLLDLREVLLNN